MDEAVVPAGPKGETSLSRAWNRCKSGTPPGPTLGTGGAARSAAPPERAAPKPWGRRLPPILC
eukprot:11116957-Alexandrium_andersonii.AAC.1